MIPSCNSLKSISFGSLAIQPFRVMRATVAGRAERTSLPATMKKNKIPKSETLEYNSWNSMRERCLNKKHPSFSRYGGRGIKICRRWDLFENFLSDMGKRPSRKHSLDRKNNQKNYTPKNCRWATKEMQSNNRCDNTFIQFEGKIKTAIQWARKLNLPYDALIYRLKKEWAIERAFRQPFKKKKI